MMAPPTLGGLMTLATGTRLGPYEIVAPLGEGGMGEVYRAHDTTLGRDVAIKILPALFVTDPERIARFERERRTLASLNHPHIAQIYGSEPLNAYASNESGRFEVYVRPFPGPDRRIPVSTNGGTHPLWSRTGKELFYRGGNGLYAVAVSMTPDFVLSQPRLLFGQSYAFGPAITYANYDVSPDGQHFVMVKRDSSFDRLSVVLNWDEELRRLAPVR